VTDRLVWARDGRDWPHREASRFVDAAGLRWHVQQFGPPAEAAPVLLLIHGTGGSLHSWRSLAPLLANHFHVVALDLPGHGFSSAAPARQMSLPGMARALAALLQALGLAPALVVGHSAGAAIAARLVLDGAITPRGLIGLNAAMLPLRGLPGLVFAPVARLLSGSRWVPRLFAGRAHDRAAVARLIAGTGSTLDAEGLELYARLMRNPGHVGGALDMMANWDLVALRTELPRLGVPLVLVTGGNDRTLPPDQALQVAARVPGARVVDLPGLGHLAHEERPEQLADIVLQLASEWKLASANGVQALKSEGLSA
jgi:magnesium chelatase accessory protein